jgi:hypothetical protein
MGDVLASQISMGQMVKLKGGRTMRKSLPVLAIGLVAGVALWLGSLSLAQGNATEASPAVPDFGDSDSNPSSTPQVVIPAQYQPDAAELQAAAESTTSDIYFTPQDENSSVTILFLYNTSNVTGTVELQTFRLAGTIFIDTSVNVPPNSLVRIAADSVSTVSATWQDAILVNFTTSSTYAKMTIPPGVKAEGYVAWNDGSTYDPLDPVPTLPLRFSADPATIFLPNINRE